jgi:Co/Zn/Cd efflux system component
VFITNFAFFTIGMVTSLISKSMGSFVDSIDMPGFVYAISLVVVGGPFIKKKQISKLAGYFQITLAVIGFIEVLRRFLGRKTS